jgi:hypothetical protein
MMSAIESFLLGIFIGLLIVACLVGVDKYLLGGSIFSFFYADILEDIRSGPDKHDVGGGETPVTPSEHNLTIILDTGACHHCRALMEEPEGKAKLDKFVKQMRAHEIDVTIVDLKLKTQDEQKQLIEDLGDKGIVLQYVPCMMVTCKEGNILAEAPQEFTTCLHDGTSVKGAGPLLAQAAESASSREAMGSTKTLPSGGGATGAPDVLPPVPGAPAHSPPRAPGPSALPAQSPGKLLAGSRHAGRRANAARITDAF